MKPQASQSFLLAARVSPRAVAATRQQTTTKPAVQAEKTIYPETPGLKTIIPISTKRNPGKNVPIGAESRISNHIIKKNNFYFYRQKKNYIFNPFFHMYGVLGFWGLPSFCKSGISVL